MHCCIIQDSGPNWAPNLTRNIENTFFKSFITISDETFIHNASWVIKIFIYRLLPLRSPYT